jgi:hypothetical protein
MTFPRAGHSLHVSFSLKNAIRILGASIAILLISFSAFSQGNAGRILGGVTDQSGGAMAGAVVTVTDTARGISRTLMTDS